MTSDRSCNSPGSWGYEEDGSGLKLLGHRWYDSATGRFVSRDPAQDGSNWYEYAGNEPTTGVDDGGLQWKRIPGGLKIRTDLSQKPYPNMHILHPNGKESVISYKGVELPTHNGRPTVKLTREERKALRPYVENFKKQARRRIEGRATEIHTSSADAAIALADAIDKAWNSERELPLTAKLLLYLQRGGFFRMMGPIAFPWAGPADAPYRRGG